jgi:MarR family transcriptional regulator for hemolysin
MPRMASAPSDPVRKFAFPKELPFDAPNYLLHLLAAISRYRDVELDHALAPINLSVARYRALNAIVIFEPCLMGELAEFIGADRTTITRTVDQLVVADLVERRTPASDRRQVELSATDAGKQLTLKARPIVFELNSRVLEGVPASLQRSVIRAEQRMFANLAVEPRAVERMLGFRRPDSDS